MVRAIGNDLHMDYSAVGLTTVLAARMEQLATPGSILLTVATLRLVEGLVQVNPLGPVPVKGVDEPVEVFELVGASAIRRRLQAAVARGAHPFCGTADRAGGAAPGAGAGGRRARAGGGTPRRGGRGQVAPCLRARPLAPHPGLAGTGERLGVLRQSHAVFPGAGPAQALCPRGVPRQHRTIRARVTGQVLTLDAALQETIPALLALLDVLPEDSPFRTLDPPQRRRRTLDGLKRVLLRGSQVQPLLMLSLRTYAGSIPKRRPCSTVWSRVCRRPGCCCWSTTAPSTGAGWGSKTYYTQLRLDPLPPVSAHEFLHALLGDAQSGAAQTAAHCAHGGQSVLPGRERAHPRGDRGAGRHAGGLSLGAGRAEHSGARTVQAVLAARIDRRLSEEKRLAADGRGHWHGGTPATVAGHC